MPGFVFFAARAYKADNGFHSRFRQASSGGYGPAFAGSSNSI
jgi:hypothetical protein